MQGGEFFPYPLTERVAHMHFGPKPLGWKAQDMLSIGLQRLTEDHSGLKIVPMHHIVIAIGEVRKGGNAEEKAFALNPSSTRDIAKRMLEMADEAEKLNALVT